MSQTQSERMVIESPMSFSGSTKRIKNLVKSTDNGYIELALAPFAIMLLVLIWSMIFIWYLIFGIFLIPYRLLRRSQRKQKKALQQHRELLAATKQ